MNITNSPYAFSEDKVTSHIELEGLEAIPISEDLWQQAQSLPPQAKAAAAIGIRLFAIGELIYNEIQHPTPMALQFPEVWEYLVMIHLKEHTLLPIL
jgi:hypothetical protein